MSSLAAKDRKDTEAQVFYALALLANASPTDQTHAKQKQAADLLGPLYHAYPEHPGIPHYLIQRRLLRCGHDVRYPLIHSAQ